MKKLFLSAIERFHELYVLFFTGFMVLRPFSVVYYLAAGIDWAVFRSFLALLEAYCALLFLRGKKAGAYLFAALMLAELLTGLIGKTFGVDSLNYMVMSLLLLFVFIFVLKKNGRTAWDVLE